MSIDKKYLNRYAKASDGKLVVKSRLASYEAVLKGRKAAAAKAGDAPASEAPATDAPAAKAKVEEAPADEITLEAILEGLTFTQLKDSVKALITLHEIDFKMPTGKAALISALEAKPEIKMILTAEGMLAFEYLAPASEAKVEEAPAGDNKEDEKSKFELDLEAFGKDSELDGEMILREFAQTKGIEEFDTKELAAISDELKALPEYA